MSIADLTVEELGTSNGVRSNRSSRSAGPVTATVVLFGILAATSNGISAVPADQEIIGHELRTSSFTTKTSIESTRRDGSDSTSSASELQKLRETSGLTWDQLARLFGVSRRAVHHWASGDNMNAHNAEVLSRVGSLVASLPGSNPTEKRAELLRARPGGSAYDLLRQEIDASGVDISGVPVSLAGLLGGTAN